MNGEIRRAKIENILKSSAVPVPGVTLAKDLDVSRQIIVSDIALLRANGLTILSTNNRTFATGVIPGRHDDRDESEDLP